MRDVYGSAGGGRVSAVAINIRLGRCLDCRDIFSPEASFVPVPKAPGWFYALCRHCYDDSRTAGRSPFRGQHVAGGIVRRIAPGQTWRPRGRPEKPLTEAQRARADRATFDDGVGPEPTQLWGRRVHYHEGERWIELA